MDTNTPPEPRLTSLSHGGGCGCKIAPGVLSEILKGTAAMPIPPELLVGIETSDDAARFAKLIKERPFASLRGTSLSAAIAYGSKLFDGNGYAGVRRVIDISGDGPNNYGAPVTPARDAATSLGIVVPILKERRLTATAYGQFILVAALISDFVTLVLLSLVIAVLSRGPSLDLLLFLALVLGFVGAARVGRWVTGNRAIARIAEELSSATAQIRVRGAFALMVLWVALAEWLGVEVILKC